MVGGFLILHEIAEPGVGHHGVGWWWVGWWSVTILGVVVVGGCRGDTKYCIVWRFKASF